MLQSRIDSFEELVKALGDGRLEASRRACPSETYFAKHARPAAQACIDWTLPAERIAPLCVPSTSALIRIPSRFRRWSVAEPLRLVPKLEVLPAFSESPRVRCYPSTAVPFVSPRDQSSCNSAVARRRGRGVGRRRGWDYCRGTASRRSQRIPQQFSRGLVRVLSGTRNSGCSDSCSLHPWNFPPSGGARARTERSLVRRPPSPSRRSPARRASRRRPDRRLDSVPGANTGHTSFDIGFGHVGLEESLSGLEPFFALQVPVRVVLDGDGSVDAAMRAVLTTS